MPQNIERPSRRSFLQSIGELGGAGAMYEAMVAMGLLQVPVATGALFHDSNIA